MELVVLAIGLVMVVEGLVLALAPGRLEELLRQLTEIPVETRRLFGLAALTLGVLLVWLTLP